MKKNNYKLVIEMFIIIALFTIMMISSVSANNMSSPWSGTIYWYDELNTSITDWTQDEGNWGYDGFGMWCQTGCDTANYIYLDSKINMFDTFSWLNITWRFNHTSNTNNFIYLCKNGQFKVAADCMQIYVSPGNTGTTDIQVNNQNDGWTGTGYNFIVDKEYEVGIYFNTTNNNYIVYVNGTSQITSSAFAFDLGDFVDTGVRTDGFNKIKQWNMFEKIGAPAPPPTSLTSTLNYPFNETHYSFINPNSTKVYNGFVNLTTNLNANCTINNSDWSINTTGGTSQLFKNNTALSEGNYSLVVNCTSGLSNRSTSFWFVLDLTKATIDIPTPLNNSIQYNNFYLNISYFDTYLYRTNTTITRLSDSMVVYNNYSGDLSGGDIYYNISHLINISSGLFLTGNYSLFGEATDTHTDNDYFIDVTLDKVTLELIDETIINYEFKGHTIKFTVPNDIILNEKQLSDRLTFTYESKDKFILKAKEQYKTIEAEKSIVYLPDSPYNYHFIIDNDLWYDHEGLKVTKWERIDEKTIKIYYLQEKLIEESHSLGGLNNINKTVYFGIAHTNINITLIDTTTLNIINQNATLEITYPISGLTNYTIENGTIYINDTEVGNVLIEVSTMGYNPSSFSQNITMGIVNNIEIYLINSSLTGPTILKLIDKNSQPVQGGVIRILRDIGGGIFVVDGDLTTNFEGETIFQFIRNTVEYKFQIFIGGVLIEETIPTLIFKDNLEIQVATTTDQLASIRDYIDTTSSLTVQNISGTFRYTFTYAGGDIKGGKLVLTKRILTSNDVIIAENTSTALFDTLTVDFIPEQGVLYMAQGFIDTNTSGSFFLVEMDTTKLQNIKHIWGNTGLFLAFLLIGGIAFLVMRTNPTVAILFTMIGLVALSLIGFVAGLSYIWLVLILIIGIIIISINKT